MNSSAQIAILVLIASVIGCVIAFVIPFPYGIIPSMLIGAAIGHFGYNFFNKSRDQKS
jgi:CHASE2 domain-containing sensor protein